MSESEAERALDLDAQARLDEQLADLDRRPANRMDIPQGPAASLRPLVTYALIAANLIMFAIELAAGASAMTPTPQKMLELGGNFAPLTLHSQPWRLVSSMFLHYGLLHVALNMVCLWQGRVVEQLFGRAGFIAIYVVAGLLGGVASMARNADVVSAGASGAVFGVYGAFGAYLVLRKSSMAGEIWEKTIRQIGTFVGINLVYGFVTPGIDMSAHIGGIVAGFAIGAALLAGKTAAAPRTQRAIGLMLAGVALTAAAIFTIRPPTDVTPVLEAFEKVESRCIDSWNQITKAGKAGTSTKDQMIAGLERDVIAPWKAMRAQVVAVEHPPARLEGLFDAMKHYAGTRQDAWEAFLAVLRASPEEEAAKLDEFRRKEGDSNRDGQAVKAELELLSKG